MIELEFSKSKALAGGILALLALAACLAWAGWVLGVLFALAFLGLGCLKLKSGHRILSALPNAAWSVLCIFTACWASGEMVKSGSFLNLEIGRILLNILLTALVCGAVYVVSANWRFSVLTATAALLILATANSFIYQFRGKELVPLDFLSIGTAMSVASKYTPNIKENMVWGWLLWGVGAFGWFALPKCSGFWGWKPRIIALAAVFAGFLTFRLCSDSIPIKTWYLEGTTMNGYYLNFWFGIRDNMVEKPDGYSEEFMAEFEAEYDLDAEGTEDMPNILVIMDESFADLRILGDVDTNVPVTPFIDSLEENTIQGYALTSVYAGNTANAEFEFLTSHSMGLLPSGSVPYQQYINGQTYSLAWFLDACGYDTAATHPFPSAGWSRAKNYPLMGFESSTFQRDYPQENMMRGLVSDQEVVEFMLEELEGQEDPQFLFGITIQNHSSYTYSGDDFPQTVQLEQYSQEYPQAEQYLTLLNESDKAVEYLITQLEEDPEDTVVLFFGDHLPKLESGLYEELHGGEFETPEEQMLQYTVPFFIWANYDIPEQEVELTSLNYLARYLVEAAGLEMGPYYQFLEEMEERIPALNAFDYYSIREDAFIPRQEAKGEEAAWLNLYAAAQYNDLFDSENRSEVFFEQFISGTE